MGLTLTTAPSSSDILALLSVAKLKANLRISHTAEDDLIADCIQEAYDWLAGEHGWLNRTLLTSTWTMTLPGFKRAVYRNDRDGRPVTEWIPTSVISLPKPPAISLTSLKYLVDGVYTDVDADLYVEKIDDTFGTINLANLAAWPTDGDVDPSAIQIVYTAGYGDAATIIEKHPAIVKALKLLASDYYRHREDTMVDIRMVEIDRKVINGVQRVAGRYRIPNSYA